MTSSGLLPSGEKRCPCKFSTGVSALFFSNNFYLSRMMTVRYYRSLCTSTPSQRDQSQPGLIPYKRGLYRKIMMGFRVERCDGCNDKETVCSLCSCVIGNVRQCSELLAIRMKRCLPTCTHQSLATLGLTLDLQCMGYHSKSEQRFPLMYSALSGYECPPIP